MEPKRIQEQGLQSSFRKDAAGWDESGRKSERVKCCGTGLRAVAPKAKTS